MFKVRFRERECGGEPRYCIIKKKKTWFCYIKRRFIPESVYSKPLLKITSVLIM